MRSKALVYSLYMGLGAGLLPVMSLSALGQTNSWTDGNGKWENSNNWSQAVAPSFSDSADLITNAGNKTVTIDATTSSSFAPTLLINNLTIAGAGGATNTLLVVNIGTIAAPLSVLTNLRLLGGAALVISNAGQVYGSNAVVGGLPATSNNLVVVTDPNSVWSLRGSLIIGSNTANSSLIISNGGTVNVNGSSFVGTDAGGTFHVSALVTGTNSIWNNNDFVSISVSTPGIALTVANGARFVGGNSVQLGRSAAANGDIVLVTDPGTTWSNTAVLQVCAFGSFSQFIVSNGATAYSGSSDIGANFSTISNAVVVTGQGSVWTVGGAITIGDSGTANSLTITNGGLATAQDEKLANTGGSGSLIVAGGTNLVYSGLGIGLAGGTGTVSVLGGALFVTNNTETATVQVNTNSTLILGSGTFKADNLIVTNGGAVEYVQAYQVDNGSVTVAGGTVQADSSYVVAPSIGSTGVVVVTAGELVATNGVIGVGNNGTATNGFGVGSMTVSNGTVLGSSILLGSSAGGQGQLTVQTNGLVSLIGTDAVLVANDVTIDGGDVEINNGIIYCGKLHPGAMTMSNGTANSQITYVGYDSQGTLSMLAGQMTVSSLLEIGQLSGSTGLVWISGGQLAATALSTTIGNQGVGQMSISNGMVTMANIFVGNSSNPGTLTLAGGTLTLNTLSLPNPSSRFNFTGGWLNALGITNSNGEMLTLGNGVTPITLSLRGGISSLGNGLQIAANATLTGFGTINGSILNYGLIVAGGGTLAFSNLVTNYGTMRASAGSVLNFGGPVVNNGAIDALNGAVNFNTLPMGNGYILTSNCVPVITSFQKVGSDIHLSFTTCTNAPYAVDFETDVVTGSWTMLTNVTGTGSIITITDAGAALLPKRFYRANLVLPP